MARRPSISPWENPVSRALRSGKVCLGALAISFPCPAVAQIAAQAGFDWLYFDMEHSGLSVDGIEPICDASKLAGIVPIAGTTGVADFLVSRPLDLGAMGVIAPHVHTRAEAELVVSAGRYAPTGTRGFITLAPSTEFEDADPGRWAETANREILVAVKVESARGIENIEEIAAVPGLDAILIGPGDLSATYGIPGQTEHPRIREAIERTLAACRRNGIAGGPHVGSAEAVREWADRGATFMSVGFDGALLLESLRRLADGARALLGDRAL